MFFEAVNERLCRLRIRGKLFNYSIINFHAPTEEKDEQEKENFYQSLTEIFNKCPKHIKMVIGDANAQVGKEEIYREVVGRNGLHDITNDNGERLISFAAAHDLVIGSTQFKHKNIHLAT
ncbi:hypothetical protein ANN_03454 [Periplaneta americana]|uniref:Craniofacial development protein 2-like n=1 Tax=Periplaneta americana TaxID=6978 RepID=A0ABQ8U3A5_PERAM|nr:hypothetical protein ANN_03454 [Periplaneta americana]